MSVEARAVIWGNLDPLLFPISLVEENGEPMKDCKLRTEKIGFTVLKRLLWLQDGQWVGWRHTEGRKHKFRLSEYSM